MRLQIRNAAVVVHVLGQRDFAAPQPAARTSSGCYASLHSASAALWCPQVCPDALGSPPGDVARS